MLQGVAVSLTPSNDTAAGPGWRQPQGLEGRVETKIFVCVYLRKFIFAFREKIIRKYTKIKNIFAKIFAKTKISTNTYAKILLFGIVIFWPDFFTIFWQKFSRQFLRKLKLMQKSSRKRKFSRKLPHFRIIFAFSENVRNRFVSTLLQGQALLVAYTG
jgi:hypothetical protein